MMPPPNLTYTDAATSSASANLAGMSIGGGGRKLDSPAFLRERLNGVTQEIASPHNLLIMGAAGLLLAVLLMKKGR
jgi:hypothetical protein